MIGEEEEDEGGVRRERRRGRARYKVKPMFLDGLCIAVSCIASHSVCTCMKRNKRGEE